MNNAEAIAKEIKIPKEKKIEKDTTFSRLLVYVKPYAGLIAVSVILASLSALLSIAAARWISKIVDKVQEGIFEEMDMKMIKYLAIVLIGMYILSMLCKIIQGVIMNYIDKKLITKLRNDLDNKRSKMSLDSINKLNIGDTLSIITNDTSILSSSFKMIATELIPAAVLFIGAVLMMIKTNLIMTLAVIISAILGMVFVVLIMSRSQKYFDEQQRLMGEIDGYVEEVFSGMNIVKAYNGEERVKSKFNKINRKMQKTDFKANCFISLMMPVITLSNNFGYIAVCVCGGLLIMKGSITFGVIVAFMMYFTYFQEPMNQISSGMQMIQRIEASGKRIFSFLDSEEMPESDAKTPVKNISGNVEFRNVRFGYDPSERMIINDFSLKVNAGQKVAIVGHTGAGKTTLINLLLRFYDVNDGSILIDGIPTDRMSKKELRDLFAVVPQETWIFQGTIRENLLMSKETNDEKKLDEVCRAAGLHHFIETLSNGYDTIISEKEGVSSGQKQQLAIARAMMADKKMLILDEATSSVDVYLEKKIPEAMDRLIEGRTSFIIAHRLSTIKNADIIIVMENGDIVECGRHDELLEKHGAYHELYYSQFADDV